MSEIEDRMTTETVEMCRGGITCGIVYNEKFTTAKQALKENDK